MSSGTYPDLWQRVDRQAAIARARGALHRIDTEPQLVEDAGVRFIVRRVTSLARKQAETAAKPAEDFDPFARPEPDLFVADLSPTHFALLNKFNVLDRHLLVVTRTALDQETLLDIADFAALVPCLAGADTLGFYNGGRAGGASQKHKHLQVVPLPLLPEVPRLPMEARIHGRGIDLPFRHAFAPLDEGEAESAAALHERYHALLASAGIEGMRRGGLLWQSAPYNLLVTRSWMLVVPRSRETFEGIEVNSLAFAGSLFVRDAAQLAAVLQAGPMAVLRTVASH